MKLSIITSCLNSSSTIARTLQSVVEQSYPCIEHIVIDGGSTDGTLAVLDQYRSNIACLISEPDNGMYDAMNKGIALATGDIVGILNADDVYATEHVLAQIAETFTANHVQACYGDLTYRDLRNTSLIIRSWKAGAFARRKFYYGWMPPHPTFFVRRSCYTDHGYYRTDLGTSADYELMLRFLVCHSITPVYIPCQLVAMRAGGASNISLAYRLKAHMMDWRAWQVNSLCPYPWTLPLKPIRKIIQWIAKGQ